MTSASPILFIGIGVFCLPVLSPVVHINFPGWLYGLGVLIILAGAGHTIWQRM